MGDKEPQCLDDETDACIKAQLKQVRLQHQPNSTPPCNRGVIGSRQFKLMHR